MYELYTVRDSPASETNNWSFNHAMGLSFFASLFSNTYIFDSAKLLIIGSIIEAGRRICQWLFERFQFQYSITAQFDEGDPAYEWIVLFLTEEKIWRRSRDFRVNAKNSKRKWGISLGSHTGGSADYVPTYNMPQLFRWNGYWLEIKRNKDMVVMPHGGDGPASTIIISIYTLNMTVLSSLVEAARLRYDEVNRSNITVHTAGTWQPPYGSTFVWSDVKHKARRPLSSVILLEGVVDSLVKDAQEFIDTEGWYLEAGIPYRRGYLLYGPPGTGKTSTIYALAGELGLEIYSLSLSSGFVDDSFLQRAVSSIPKRSILLIEDIDCAFPSREDDEDEHVLTAGYSRRGFPMSMRHSPGRTTVTLSGLLNVIDGVSSEEGKLFFATTNYIDRLDPALLRPGRIDKKIQYKLATRAQAAALYIRFFSYKGTSSSAGQPDPTSSEKGNSGHIADLAEKFVEGIPNHEFSTAELQGYLLSCKKQPEEAVAGIGAWVKRELAERQDKMERDKKDKEKARELKEKLGGMTTSYPPGTTEAVAPSGLSIPLDTSITPMTPSPAYDAALSISSLAPNT